MIKGPVDEINRLTDFNITVAYQREKRKVAAIKFRVEQEKQLPGSVVRQGALFPDLDDMPPIVKELKEAGLSADDAWKVWQQEFEFVRPDKRPEEVSFETYIHEKLDLLKRRKTEGKVKSSTGFLLKAIKENYANAEYTEAERRKAAKQQAEEKAHTRRQLEKEKECLEQERSAVLHDRCEQLLAEQPDLLPEAVETLLAESAGFQRFYDSEKTPEENYQRKFLSDWVDEYLERTQTERFQDLSTVYDKKLAAIEKKLMKKKPWEV